MDSRADAGVVGTEQADEQRLREAAGERRSLHLRGDESPDGQAFGSLMRLSRQFQAKVRLPRIHSGRRQPATQSRLRTAVEVLKALDTVFIIEAESDY
jgi:hypothetical protein